MLGHSSIRMTEKSYAFLAPNAGTEMAAQLLDNLHKQHDNEPVLFLPKLAIRHIGIQVQTLAGLLPSVYGHLPQCAEVSQPALPMSTGPPVRKVLLPLLTSIRDMLAASDLNLL